MKSRPRRNSTINNPIYERVVRIISDARKEADLSQQELADLIGMLQPHISQIEKCQRRVDALELLNIVDSIAGGKRRMLKSFGKKFRMNFIKQKRKDNFIFIFYLNIADPFSLHLSCALAATLLLTKSSK